MLDLMVSDDLFMASVWLVMCFHNQIGLLEFICTDHNFLFNIVSINIHVLNILLF